MYLCKCNNCDEIWEDMNPSCNSFEIDPDKLNEIPLPLELFEDDGDHFWGCPICETDDYLSDINNQDLYDGLT